MKRKQIIDFLTIVLFFGVLLSLILIKSTYDDCAYRWTNNIDGFGKKYESVQDCFVTRSTGSILFSIFLGMGVSLTGLYLIRSA